MFCRKKDSTLVDMSKGVNRSCAMSKCGGWRWVGSSCSPGDLCKVGLKGAWLPAVEVCRIYIWGTSKAPSAPRLPKETDASSSSSASGPEYQYESSSSASEPEYQYESSSSASEPEYQYESSSSASAPEEQSSSSSSELEPIFFVSHHPQNNSTIAGSFEPSLFSVVVSAPGDVIYAWQWSLDGGVTWYDINPDGGVFFQANTDTMGVNPGITDTSSTWNGSRFRAKVTYGSDTIFSDAATLTVTSDPPTAEPSSSSQGVAAPFQIVQQPSNYSTTAGEFEASMFSVVVSAPGTVTYAWQWSLDGGNTWYDINPSGGVFFQADTDSVGVYPDMTDTSSTWNGSRFRAKVTYGSDTIFSNAATLTVNP